MPVCRNGRRCGLKIRWWQHRVGSSPTTGTTSEWTMLHSKSPASWLGFSHTAPSFLLFPTKLCCANLRRAPPYGLRRKAGIHFITPTQPLKPLGKAIPGRFCFCNNTLLPGCGTRVNDRHTGQHTSNIVNRHNAQL